MKRMKCSTFVVVVLLLAVLACAGTAGAVSITAEEWNNLTTSDQINGNTSYEFTGTGIINPKFTGSASSKYVPNRSITFDFTDFQGTFAGVPAGTKSYLGALFGNVRNTTGAFAITITNLTLTDVTVTSTTGSHIGGIVGYLQGASKGDVTLNLVNCNLVNCTIASAKSSPSGGLIGNLKFQANGNVTLNVTGCHLLNTTIAGAGGQAGGLFGIFTYPGSSFGPFSVAADSTAFPPFHPTTSGKVNIDTCSAQHCSISGQGGIGSLIGYCTGGGYLIPVTDCAVDACVLSGSSRIGGIAGDIGGGSVSFARCTVENTSLVITDQNQGSKLGGLLGGNDASAVKGITNCTVKNCLMVSSTKLANMIGYGGLLGGAKSVTGVTNSTVMNCAVIGASQVGGLIGGSLSEPSGCSDNMLMNSAVSGNMTTQLDCGNYSGSVGCTVICSYIDNSSADQPTIITYPLSGTPRPAPTYFGTITITNVSGIGTVNDSMYAAAYVCYTHTPLVFNPSNGSAAYTGTIALGDTAIGRPVKGGYSFTSWNLSSDEGIMLTDQIGTLQANISGYTNASGMWNNASGIIVNLYANWTVNTSHVAADTNGTAVFGNTNATAVHSTAGNKISTIILEDVGNVSAGTTVEFTADNTTVRDIPDISSHNKIELSIFEINATVSSGIPARFNLTVLFCDDATAAKFMHDIRIWHYNASEGTWDKQPLGYELNRTNETVTYTVSTTSFSPFGMGIYTATSSPSPSSSGSSRQAGSTIILPETAVLTVTPTVVSTAMPTVIQTVKPTTLPTTLPTQSSPVPFIGLIAGLGVAILVRLRMRF